MAKTLLRHFSRFSHFRKYCLCLGSIAVLYTVFIFFWKNNVSVKNAAVSSHTASSYELQQNGHSYEVQKNGHAYEVQRKGQSYEVQRKGQSYEVQQKGQSLTLVSASKHDKNETDHETKENQILDEEVVYETVQNIHNSLYLNKTIEECVPRLPTCIIIGVTKCGTRELIDFMAMHPNIVIKRKPVYETHYFEHMRQSLEWYRSQMPCSYSDQHTVTKNPFYFGHQIVPERLYRYNKTLKMILLVREPVERIVSALSFQFLHKQSVRNISDLVEMPEVDDQLVNHAIGQIKPHEEIIRSTYDISMKRYLRYFSREQILIIETHEFKNNPAKVLNKVETFLGLEHYISEDMFVYNREKQHYCIRVQEGGMACYGTSRGRKSQKPLRENTVKILNKYFDQHNKAFFELINERYDW